jgi:hypothetical protein
VTTEVTIDATRIMEAFARLPRRIPVPAHPDTERRTRYAAAIRHHIKALTLPAPTPGGAPLLGATEYDLADVVLLLADAELDQLGEELDAAGATIAGQTAQMTELRAALDQTRAERDAALRVAEVWADAPDPLVRHSAADLADLLSAIRGARPARLLNCGWCHEEDGEEVHPHPECPVRTTPGTATEATEHCPTPETHNWGCGCPTDQLPLHAESGIDTPGCDCRHNGMGPKWHAQACTWLATMTVPHPDTVTAAPCGETSTGMYGRLLGPCLNTPHPPTTFHRDAHGAEWREYGPDDQLRAERDRYAKALDKIGDFNKLVAEGSCRVHAAEQARDTLAILDRHLRPPAAPRRPEKGQR